MHARKSAPDLILDGLIGYGLKGAPRGTVADLIQWADDCGAQIVSLDVPSGVDAMARPVSRKVHQARTDDNVGAAKNGALVGKNGRAFSERHRNTGRCLRAP